MRNYKIVVLLITASLLASFSPPKEINWDNLEGIWMYKSQMDDVTLFEKVDSFEKSMGRYKFEKDGILTVKQNLGRCATPPISYQLVTGTWTIINDSVIHIEHRNERGTISEDLHIISLSKSEMAFKVL